MSTGLEATEPVSMVKLFGPKIECKLCKYIYIELKVQQSLPECVNGKTFIASPIALAKFSPKTLYLSFPNATAMATTDASKYSLAQ